MPVAVLLPLTPLVFEGVVRPFLAGLAGVLAGFLAARTGFLVRVVGRRAATGLRSGTEASLYGAAL